MKTILCIAALCSAILVATGIFYNLFTQSQKERPCFVLLTDFGYDFAVGSMKGTILSKIPNAQVIDLDHSIEKFNTISAGFVLANSYHYFPKGTIFLCIVDPHVGTTRAPICIQTPSYTFIGPNNGLFHAILEKEPTRTIYEIDNSYLKPGANTFHGRDLFAPAAVDFYRKYLTHFKVFNEKNLVSGPNDKREIIATYIDSFGNVKTNKVLDSEKQQNDFFIINQGTKKIRIPFVKTFNDVGISELLCYGGSNSTLEIAVNQGSAAELLGIKVGDRISLST